jgi:hypothetical protein
MEILQQDCIDFQSSTMHFVTLIIFTERVKALYDVIIYRIHGSKESSQCGSNSAMV